jgi:hypothetical protein
MKHDLEKNRLAFVVRGRCVRCGEPASRYDECPAPPRWEDTFNKDGTRKVKLTEEQVAEERRRLTLLNGHPEDVVYSCDSCGGRNDCAYAFDGYNTNGDCLAEK